jgi:hypothetical protein
VTTSSGALQVVEQDATRWTREEGLSDLAAIRFIDLGEPEVEQAGHVIEEEGFLGRLARHVSELTVSLACEWCAKNRLYPRTWVGSPPA